MVRSGLRVALNCRPALVGCCCTCSSYAAGCGEKTHCGCGSGDGVVDLQLGKEPLEGVIQGVHITFLLLLLLVEQASYQQSAAAANVWRCFSDDETIISGLAVLGKHSRSIQKAPLRAEQGHCLSCTSTWPTWISKLPLGLKACWQHPTSLLLGQEFSRGKSLHAKGMPGLATCPA